MSSVKSVFDLRDGAGISQRSQFGIKIDYEFSRHLSFDLDISHFIASDFLEATGDSQDILHIAPTLNYRF